MIRADFALRRAGQLATMVPAGGDPLGCIPDGALAARDGRVVWVGREADIESRVHLEGELVDAGGRCVLPGLVDAHTHPVFIGSRADEFAERLSGVSYTDQQVGDRGIWRTVRATRAASEEALLAAAFARARRFLQYGTTTIEAKTGYGLDFASEAKALAVLASLATATPLRVIPTFLGAHVVPEGIERAQYLRSLTDEMLPAFRTAARFCDAWCDPPAFTPDETRLVLGTAKALGYGLRLHAAQLGPGEGPAIAAELGAYSADHLDFITPEQIAALARAGTVAVLCPGANFTTPGSGRPPVEALQEAGVPVALATDLNPGTCYSESLSFAMSLGCVLWGMTPQDVVVATTRNGARAVGWDGLAGCLRLGSFADCVVFDVGAPEEIPYHVGVNRASMTIVGGRVWRGP